MISQNYEQIRSVIRNEIENDPVNMGYSGKSTQEKADLINNCYFTQDENLEQVENTPRLYQISIGVPYCPNAILVQDLEVILNG